MVTKAERETRRRKHQHTRSTREREPHGPNDAARKLANDLLVVIADFHETTQAGAELWLTEPAVCWLRRKRSYTEIYCRSRAVLEAVLDLVKRAALDPENDDLGFGGYEFSKVYVTGDGWWDIRAYPHQGIRGNPRLRRQRGAVA